MRASTLCSRLHASGAVAASSRSSRARASTRGCRRTSASIGCATWTPSPACQRAAAGDVQSGATPACTGLPTPPCARPAGVTRGARPCTAAWAPAWGLGDAAAALCWGAPARRATALPLVGRLKAAIELAGGPSEVPPTLCGARLQGVQPLWPQDHSWFLDGCHGDGSHPRALVGWARDALLALLGCVARVPHASAPLVAPVVGPAPGRQLPARGCSAASGGPRALHARPRAPAAAPGAKARSTGVEGRAGWPCASGGRGRHCPCLPG